MSRRTTWFVTCLLLAYFVFTSGFAYWVSRCEVTDRFIMPFSWALDSDAGFTPIATQSDMDCVRWLVEESIPNTRIAGDSSGLFYITGYMKVGTGAARPDKKPKGRWYWINDMFDTGDCYLFLSDWNIRHSEYIICNDVGLRKHFPFNITDNSDGYLTYTADVPFYEGLKILDETVSKQVVIKEVYRSDNSRVYEVVSH